MDLSKAVGGRLIQNETNTALQVVLDDKNHRRTQVWLPREFPYVT